MEGTSVNFLEDSQGYSSSSCVVPGCSMGLGRVAAGVAYTGNTSVDRALL